MYHALLANRYLTSRVIPFVAVAAVGLCVALVIIVVSVMSGFLDQVRDSGRRLVGDAIMTAPYDGFPDPEELVEFLEEDERIAAACPVVDGMGIVQVPYPDFGPRGGLIDVNRPVQFWGIDPARFAAVSEYADTIYWRDPGEDGLDDVSAFQARLLEDRRVGRAGMAERERLALTLETPAWLNLDEDDAGDEDAAEVFRRGAVLGLHVSQANQRTDDGSVRPAGGVWMPAFDVTLVTLPSEGATTEPERVRLGVVNESKSGIFLIDETRMFVSLEVAQKLRGMHAYSVRATDAAGNTILDEETFLPKVIGRVPARATQILLRGTDGIDPVALREAASERYVQWARQWNEDRPDAAVAEGLFAPLPGRGMVAQTWEEQQERFIGPIELEREMMRTLFSMVYLVCAGLVLAIFWAIVYEKTRDIGILRAVGASRMGIAFIFVRYGLFIGVFGAFVGLGLGALVVRNINLIHDALGDPPEWLGITFAVLALICLVWTAMKVPARRLLPIGLGTLGVCVFALCTTLVFTVEVQVWDAQTYYFEEIPSRMDSFTAITTMIGAVLFSVLGAFFPAARAADVDPVRALRYE